MRISPASPVTSGLIDLHFHGAFGVDLMRASRPELEALSRRLAQAGMAAFCPTTLSTPWPELVQAVTTLGRWIETHRPGADRARPLGIHLEGPYLAAGACGAHPPSALREARLSELRTLWEASRGSLKILTLAPERAPAAELRGIVKFCRAHGILLSLGHSRAGAAEANAAFARGFGGVTHAWNAMPFHHRDPGILGAALGRPDIHLELILDQIHVAPEVLRWTRRLHDRLSYVSDCAPAAETRPGTLSTFGSLRIQHRDGACFTRSRPPHLAGGGRLLSHQFAAWVGAESHREGRPWPVILRRELPHVTRIPLAALGLRSLARGPRIRWENRPGKAPAFHPVSS